MAKPKQRLPKGMTEAKVRAIIDHYENQTEEEAVAEDEAAFGRGLTTVMEIPTELVADVLALIKDRQSTSSKKPKSSPRRKSA